MSTVPPSTAPSHGSSADGATAEKSIEWLSTHLSGLPPWQRLANNDTTRALVDRFRGAVDDPTRGRFYTRLRDDQVPRDDPDTYRSHLQNAATGLKSEQVYGPPSSRQFMIDYKKRNCTCEQDPPHYTQAFQRDHPDEPAHARTWLIRPPLSTAATCGLTDAQKTMLTVAACTRPECLTASAEEWENGKVADFAGRTRPQIWKILTTGKDFTAKTVDTRENNMLGPVYLPIPGTESANDDGSGDSGLSAHAVFCLTEFDPVPLDVPALTSRKPGQPALALAYDRRVAGAEASVGSVSPGSETVKRKASAMETPAPASKTDKRMSLSHVMG